MVCTEYRQFAIILPVPDIELHDEVLRWLNQLTEDEWQRVAVIIDRLAETGAQARMPLSRSLGAGLFELRFALGSKARRITYRFTADDRIVLLTTFRKQRANERAEVRRARRAAQDCARKDP